MCDKSNLEKVYDVLEAMTDDEITEAFPITTEYVEMPWGEQMMFAVPVESENINENVSRIEEIKKEIIKYFHDCIAKSEQILNRDVDYSYTFKCILNTDIDANVRAKEEIIKIFDKY